MSYAVPRRFRFSDHPALVLLLYPLVIGVILLLSYWWKVYSCDELQSNTGKPTRYTIANGCLVKVGGDWVPEQRWREVE